MFPDALKSDLAGRIFRMTAVIAVGLTVEVLRGSLIPVLAPLIAVAVLAGLREPLGPVKGIAAAGLLSVTSLLVLILTKVALGYAGVYTLVISLLYLWSFYLCLGQRTAVVGKVFLTMTVSVSALSAASTVLAAVVVREMTISAVVGVGLLVLIGMIWPFRQLPDESAQQNVNTKPDVSQAVHAAMATLVMVPLHLYLTFDGLAAIVILLTAAMMLSQPGLRQIINYGFGFALGNVIGGGLALIAASVTELQSAFPVYFSVTLACALALAGGQAGSWRLASVFVPASSAFLLLYGMTWSPLATGDDVAVATRIVQILAAIAYVMAACSLLEVFAGRRFRPETMRNQPV